jgi:hypothetical protein
VPSSPHTYSYTRSDSHPSPVSPSSIIRLRPSPPQAPPRPHGHLIDIPLRRPRLSSTPSKSTIPPSISPLTSSSQLLIDVFVHHSSSSTAHLVRTAPLPIHDPAHHAVPSVVWSSFTLTSSPVASHAVFTRAPIRCLFQLVCPFCIFTRVG